MTIALAAGNRLTLTPTLLHAFRYVESFIREHEGVAPSFEEMMVGFDVRSKSRVHAILSHLEERGWIRRAYGRSRAIEIIHSGPSAVQSSNLEIRT